MTLAGQEGAVKWGYQPAVSFLAWRFEGTTEGGTLTAEIARTDEFLVLQTPLVVVVPLGASQVRWPVRDFARTGSTLKVTCGPRERRDA